MSVRRAAVVGAGAQGMAWGRTLAACPDTEIVAWIDVDTGRAEKAALELELGDVMTADGLEEAVKASRPDFVVDVSPPDAHCAVVCEALGLGLPVIGEKPMASSMDEARQMVAASRAADKLYMVSQSRRYNAPMEQYRALVRSLDGVASLNADFFLGPHFGGFRDEMPSPLLLDMSIHTFDQARYLLDADPVSVYCEEFNPAWSWYDGAACANALFEMSDGSRFAFRGSWCAEGLMTSWDSDWRACGRNGTATWDGERDLRIESVHQADGFFSKVNHLRPAVDDEGFAYGLDGSLAEFLRALETGETPQGECSDNIKSLAMVFAALASAKTGTRVAIADVLSA